MFDRANRMAVAAKRRVVASLSHVLEPGRDGGLVGQRREYNPGIGRGGMQYDAGLQAGVKPLPCYHQRFLDRALAARDDAGSARVSGSVNGIVADPIGTAAAAGFAGEHSFNRGQQACDGERLLEEVLGTEPSGS